MYQRIDRILEHKDFDLPDTVDLTQREIDEHWTLYMYWIATGKKHLPSDLKRQSSKELRVLLTLDGVFEKMIEQDAEANAQ